MKNGGVLWHPPFFRSSVTPNPEPRTFELLNAVAVQNPERSNSLTPFAVFRSRRRRLSSIQQRTLTKAVMREPAFRFQCRHATGSCGGDRLTVITVHHIARREHAGDIRLRAPRLRHLDVTGRMQIDLATEKRCVRCMTDRDE